MKTVRRIAAVLLVLLAILGGVAWHGLSEATSQPVVRRLTYPLPGLPAGTAPIRVALLSDIHIGNRAMTADRLRGIVSAVNVEKPDIVLLAGDFTIGHEPGQSTPLAPLLTLPLAALKAPMGVWAVPGNHDFWTGAAPIRRALAGAGIDMPMNRTVRAGPLALLLIADPVTGADNLPAAIAQWKLLGGAPVVVAHSPDLAPRLPPDLPLLLAGHTHCGQIVLPRIGPLVELLSTDRVERYYDPHYRCGVVRDGARTVVVTGGVGSGTIPLRIGAPPDWWLVTLVPPAG